MSEPAMIEPAQINTEVLQERDSVSALFQRRIEFHLARKPFNGFESYRNNGFKLVTLNPDAESHKDPNSSEKSEKVDRLETGFDPDLTFEISFRRIGAGLRNLGNTCFLNSVLQCLTYTEPLAAYLQSGKHQTSCRKAGFCALCAIQKHVSRALQATGRILEPKDLVSNLRCISRSFRNARQEDAHEYMRFLLESMHKCCLPPGVPCESEAAYERSLVYRIFGGSLRSQVKCMQCSFCSNKIDPFLDLSLEVVKVDSINKALAHYTAKEQLEGGAKQYQCQQCKQKVKALKQLTIHKAPHVLTVHLKRFDAHKTGQKINKNIYFGPTLDLKPFVTGPYVGDLSYTLYGVLVHAGWSTHSGHYYCFVRTSSGMWYSLDDNQVVQVNERTVLDQKAYMLFYVRDRKNIPTKKSVETIKKENMVLNAISNAACSKFNNEPKGKTQIVPIERNRDEVSPVSVTDGGTLISSAPKETPLEKGSIEKLYISAAHPSSIPDEVLHTENSSVAPLELDTLRAHSSATIASKGNVKESSSEVQALNGFARISSEENGDAPPVPSISFSDEPLTCAQPELVPDIQVAHTNSACSANPKKRNCPNVEKKYLKNQAAGPSLSSKILFSFIGSTRKKHHKKRKRQSLHNCTSNDGPSVSGQSLTALDFARSQKTMNYGSVGKNQNPKSNSESESITGDASSLYVASQRPAEECLRESKQAEAMGMLTRGLDCRLGFAVASWDGIDVSTVEKNEEPRSQPVRIGYIGDEWDEEYDRGKRKKFKYSSRFEFSESNPFQEIATRNEETRRAKLQHRSSSESCSFRIK